MSCTNTNSQSLGYYPNTTGCVNCPSPCPDGCDPKDASCIVYTGAPLNCIQADSNTNLETIIQLIDARVCETSGDFTGYNFYCLIDQGAINTQQQFVERISQFACQTRTDFTNFVTNTYTPGIAGLQNQINSLKNPNITSCDELNIVSTDVQNVVLTKLSNSICAIYSAINPSSANWSQCFSVVGDPPATIVEGFNTILDQLCQIKTGGGSAALPTFNNVGSCLPAPLTTADTLVSTIAKIKTRLCQTPTFNAGNLTTPVCVQYSGASTLENVLDAVINQVNQLSLNTVRAFNNSQFTVSLIDPSSPCLGKQLSLATANIDRMVALNTTDVTPGTLQDKIAQGPNITLDFGNTNPGKLTISATATSNTDEKVKVNGSDASAGYLETKVVGSTDLVSVTVLPINTSSQLKISANLDMEALINLILETIGDDEDLKVKFCTLVSSCPSPCDPPTNVQVIPA